MFTIRNIARLERDTSSLLEDICELLENCELDTSVDYEKYKDNTAQLLNYVSDDIRCSLIYLSRIKRILEKSD